MAGPDETMALLLTEATNDYSVLLSNALTWLEKRMDLG